MIIPIFLFLILIPIAAPFPKWSTYRPQYFFGTRTMSNTEYDATGLMWYSGDSRTGFQNLRHQTNNQVKNFFWEFHDGHRVGKQVVVDPSCGNGGLLLNTTWFNPSDDSWDILVEGESLNSVAQSTIGIVWYHLFHDFGPVDKRGRGKHFPSFPQKITTHHDKNGAEFPIIITGRTPELGSFELIIDLSSNSTHPKKPRSRTSTTKTILNRAQFQSFKYSHSPANEETVGTYHWHSWNFQQLFEQQLGSTLGHHRTTPASSSSRKISMKERYPRLSNSWEGKNPVQAFQIYLKTPFTLSVSFRPLNKQSMEIEEPVFDSIDSKIKYLQSEISLARSEFLSRFIDTWNIIPEHKHFNFAVEALSNLLGGIGYFYGPQVILSDSGKMTQILANTGLLSATPSRTMFPRGFLWDEGFHQLIISKWDPQLSQDMISSWFQMQNEGWIPREMILGSEPSIRVPYEFLPQNRLHANPPALLLAIESMLDDLQNHMSMDDINEGLHPSTVNQPSTSKHFVDSLQFHNFLTQNYNTLLKWFEWFIITQQGPRIDTFQWKGRTSNHTLASGLDDYPRIDPPNANEVHVDLHSWMIYFASVLDKINTYLDIDTHHLAEKDFHQLRQRWIDGLDSLFWDESRSRYCDVSGSKTDDGPCPVGYMNLFPFMLVPETRKNTKTWKPILDKISSPFGILSMATDDPYFGTGENYWKGPIWIPLNHLILQGLKDVDIETYDQISENLVDNIYSNWESSGYFYEQYHPLTGKGQRGHPFNGWTSVILMYLGRF